LITNVRVGYISKCHCFLVYCVSNNINDKGGAYVWTKIVPFHGEISTMVPWTRLSQPPNGISISSAVFAQLTRVSNTKTDGHTDWPTYKHTDHATCDICSNRPHLTHCVQAVRPKKIHKKTLFFTYAHIYVTA